MRPKLLCLLVNILFTPYICSQITIEDCYQKAEANYPLIKQYELIERTKEFNLSNIGKGYLPQMQLSAKATYQSEVTEIPINIPGIEGLSKDQYGAVLDVNQIIWDGGIINSKKDIVRVKSEVETKNLEVTLYAIKERVNQLFFGILLHDALLDQNEIYQIELRRNFDQVKAYINNGVANQADLDAVKLEQAKTFQQKTELKHNRNAYLLMLSALIGEPLVEDAVLQEPDMSQVSLGDVRRPELGYFDAQLRSFDAQKKSLKASLMPQIGAFVTGGYGRPGLNMLENKFSPYYIGGLRISWSISSLYTRKNNIKSLDVDRNLIENQRETFFFNTHLDIINSNSEIKKIRELLTTDDEIIRLRTSIKKLAETKSANGTLSILDLMKEVNAEQMAKQTKIVHEIQLLQAIYNLKYITNN